MSARQSIENAWRSGPVTRDDGAHRVQFQFDADDPTFAGHFPGNPILPGVFQIEMTRLAAERVLGATLGVQEITKAKFQRPIRPGENMELVLKLSVEQRTIVARASFLVSGQAAGEALVTLCRSDERNG
jgi:3-hydroxyacyl-[acyl-carrier-protein] dehydratase